MRRIKLSDWEIYHLDGSNFALDGGAMFGVVPKVLWEKLIQPDERNRIPMSTHPILIKTDRKIVLVDVGLGKGWNSKFKDIYAIEERDIFEGTDFSYEDVDILVATHLHFDHMAGAVDEHGNLLFRKAKIVVQAWEWADALYPNVRSKASYIKERIEPLSSNLELVEGTVQIEEGIWLILTGGHTRGHQIVLVERNGKGLLFMADLVPTIHHIHYPYIMAYDLYPMDVLKARYEIYNEALKYNYLLVFEHDREGRMGYLSIKDNKPYVQLV